MGEDGKLSKTVKSMINKALNHQLDLKVLMRKFSRHLQTSGLPDPELLIRSSGEMRLSNFLIWQSAYSEYVFDEAFWPDFNEQNVWEALRVFQRRNRRFGSSSDAS